MEVYFRTMIQYLTLRFVEYLQNTFVPWHKFAISLPRVLDDRYTCWELVYKFARVMGKPIQESAGLSASRYPLISDFVRAMKGRRVEWK